jgi:transcriptional regulator with XRE-family HTH domain
MKVILRKLGQRVRTLRELRGISQEDFATRCGLHRTGVGLLERGARIPRLDTLMILSRALRISVSDLVRGVERWGTVPRKKRPRIKKSK